jgi:aspartyl-tRNA(Asn)/glutamyl-tRNA(Gln) amidotransferase subunit C
MSSTFSRDEIARVARLARLALTDEETDLFARQLGDILEYARQIAAVDTSHVTPTAHAGAATPLREDRVQPSLPRDAALAAAPEADREAGFFKVPRVLA